MRYDSINARMICAEITASVLLLASGASFAQQQVNLTAGPATATLPDGSSVPMWGYSCGPAVSGSTATCGPLSPLAAMAPGVWSPVVITVPTNQDLQINLTNNLSFTTGSTTPPNNIPTSLVIVGQVGGGLGDVSQRTTAPSPTHDNQPTTWPIANTGAVFTPPAQGSRVQSFATEVAMGKTTSLTWTAPRPGTYLLESGTHPSIQGPMGLYGVVIVTNSSTGTAYPDLQYAAELPLLFSEIDPAQNNAVNDAVHSAGFSESATLGPYLAGPVVSISLTNGGAGYTSAPAVSFTGGGGSGGASATAVIDTDNTSPTFGQVTQVNPGSPGSYTTAPTIIFSGGGGKGASAVAALQLNANGITHCQLPGGATANACYPPAVNYTPLYYLVNGVAFDKTNASNSLFPAVPGTQATPVSGNVLVRMVNAGLRMHVPSIVGSLTGATPAAGFSLIAEDGNPLPGVRRVQSAVFMPAGKTYDVMINAPQPRMSGTVAVAPPALPIFDRQLSLSANATERDAGMLAYIGVNGGVLPTTPTLGAAIANPDTYNAVIAGKTLTVSDPTKGVIANDVNIYGVKVVTAPTQGALTLNLNGTFTYAASSTWTAPDTFTYCGNGAMSGPACAIVTLGAASIESGTGITCLVPAPTYQSTVATTLSIKPPGILSFCNDAAGYPLTVNVASVTSTGFTTLSVDQNGGFNAIVPAPGNYSFSFSAQNSQGTVGALAATVTLTFPSANGPTVTVLDGADKTTTITDYRWIIEEDRTFYVDPNCTTNPLPASCPTVTPQRGPAVFGTNFHTSHMPVVASGCTGKLSCEGGQSRQGSTVVCDQGNGICRPDASGAGQTAVDPSQVHLDPSKRYYISVLPGDAANPFIAGYAGPPDCSTAGNCGHGMGGAPIGKGGNQFVTVLTQPSPYPPAKLSVFVFEDDYPLNGEHDASGGIDVLAINEPGLGGFQITLFDDAGGPGDSTGQPTYDMFNMPLTNSLAGTIDPITGLDACPLSTQVTANATTGDGSQKGIVGMIVTCPKYESDGKTMSPLAGQAIVNNLYQGRYGVVATPGADRIARGEEWLQTNTLDGQKAHDSFMRIGEPAYFQEFGPAGYHVSIGFANPKIINDRRTNGQGSGMCDAAPRGGALTCNKEVKGHVTTARMSRPPDERLYGSGTRDSFAFTQCYASLGDPDGADFAFVKCDDHGNFDFTGIPAGNWKLTVFDQWNDQIVDGISTPVGLTGTSNLLDMGEVAVHQWQANIYTRTFLDTNGDGVSQDTEPGLTLVATNIRFRDGSFSNFNNTDLNGFAGFNEIFPLFNWYVIETDTTRYKSTGVHVVYDAGGPVDGSSPGGTACGPTTATPCGNSSIGRNLANTYQANPLPANLSVPGAVYCAEGADCGSSSVRNGPSPSSASNHSTGRIDPPLWFGSYGWQGFAGQNSFLEFGKKPFAEHENGGIHGHVVYASTRPFDDPQLLLQLSWEPLVPHVRVNLYKEGFAADGISPTLTLVDHTDTSSFDDWAQGFRSDGVPNMNCAGQSTGDLFYYSLQNQPNWLDIYNNTGKTLPYNSQFKCYDGMHNFNQLQPAPYDGMYSFPSVTGIDPVTGKPSGTNCIGCTTNPDSTDPYRYGAPMLPPGKYVVEVVVPPGYELVKEEDKNILIGDNYIAPVTQQFAGLGSIFILPDQAEIAAFYNNSNPQNPTNTLGRVSSLPSHEGDTGSVETFWPCVGAARVVPDYISLFPGSAEVAPFAGAMRNLCDRKEVTLTDQSSALAKFYIFTSTHVASHFTGLITDDFTAEFDPFSPQFGEKFAPGYLPVSIKDWAGNEISRTYADQWGAYNGLNYSTWEVNPPNPTGYGPTMMVMCMNDRGTGTTPDPLYQAGYSQFCYHLPFMPGQTGYFDTPVVPTSAFSEGYNHPDCAYPDATPAISEVDGDTSYAVQGGGVGPWVSAPGHTLTIQALGDQPVDNHGYSGPSATRAPFNQKKISRHYGFGTTRGSVSIGGINLTASQITGWTDTTITVTVPSTVPNCAIQQQAQYSGGASTAKCGQLVITAANGKQSIDAVTVTVGGKAPTRLATGQTIQSAIDAASPGDLIIVPPGVYNELLLMWKPLRLQGVGAASSIIDGSSHPAGEAKLDPWRRKVLCLFGLALNGTPISATNRYDPSNPHACTGSQPPDPADPYPNMQFAIDRLPLEATVGWTNTLNGNLAEQLNEPTLMGAYEGAGITVLAKGVDFHGAYPWNDGTEAAAFPAATTLLRSADCTQNGSNPFPSNFWCNPSSIDGLGVTNSSQGGGGILVHGWGHNIEIANNRVYNNQGTIAGGIAIGQGEHPDVYLAGALPTTNPGSCETSGVTNQSLPFCFDMNVKVHNNAVTLNASEGDELFSSTPSGAGGVSFCSGTDYYNFSYNWICGNVSTGDGGGVAHVGFSKNGDIEHNSILFNQSTNPTITTNGGGLLVMGAPDTDPPCSTNDQDCVSPPSMISPSDGTGPGLVINANLILGNSADSGSGGGLRLQHVNGTDVLNLPNGAQRCPNLTNCLWNSVRVTNNIIANNVAGWDGAGISLQDALAVNIVNNTIVSNDTTASSGVLFNSLFAPLASVGGTDCTTNNGTRSCPQPAGLVSVTNSPVLKANLPSSGFSCPTGHGTNGSCRNYSVPLLQNDLFWQNRSFYIAVAQPTGTGSTGQQSTVTLYNSFGTTPAPSQASTGACPTASYWDIGVRGDTGPAPNQRASGFALAPTFSVLTALSTGANPYPNANNTVSNPAVASQYCNGSRVPPENGGMGWQVPPGTNEANALPTPVFSLRPSATVDEGNNWVNLRWGPLSQSHPVSGATLGNYSITVGSSAMDTGTSTNAPATDFFGNPRPAGNGPDMGAVEYPEITLSPSSVSFGNQPVQTTSAARTFTLSNPAIGVTVTGIVVSFTGTNAADYAVTGNTCGSSVAPGAQCTISVTFRPSAGGARTATLTVTDSEGKQTASLTGTGIAVAVTGGPLAFGSVPRTTTSAPQTLTLTNSGATSATGISLAFSPAVFSRPAAGGTCTTTLAAGASCTINVVFTPTAVGAVSGTLTITSNLSVSGSPVALTGTGIAVTVTGGPLAFGNVPLTTTSAARTVTLTNYGTTSATGISLAFSPAVFSRPAAGGTCTATLAANASCTISVVFSPTALGSVSGTLTITANVSVFGSPVTLTGTGIAGGPAASLSPATWSVTAARGVPNGAGPGQSFTLTNTGTVTLTGIGQGVLSGPKAPDWVMAPGMSSCGVTTLSLPVGTSCVVGVQFQPPTTETPNVPLSATLTVSYTGGSQTAALTGTAQ